jgi:hypothetical protein
MSMIRQELQIHDLEDEALGEGLINEELPYCTEHRMNGTRQVEFSIDTTIGKRTAIVFLCPMCMVEIKALREKGEAA